MPKIKSNDRMPARTYGNMVGVLDEIQRWKSPHKHKAIDFANRMGAEDLFTLLHAIRRWYSGQTMARRILAYREHLSLAMRLAPRDALGVYRGIRVDLDNPLSRVKEGQRLSIPVTRNHGFSSWCTTVEPTNRFSGAAPGRVGLILQLADCRGVTPVLAPPEHTQPWFNALYARLIGSSYRPTEGEYLLASKRIDVRVVRVKK